MLVRALLAAQLLLASAGAFSPPVQALRGGCRDISMQASSSKCLAGQRVLVTGAGRGIGRAIAKICASEGADVAVMARTAAQVEELAAELQKEYGTKAVALSADVTKEDQVQSAVKSAVSELGSIDVLINNAGMGGAKVPFYEQKLDEFRQIMDLNCASVLVVSTAVLKEGGMLASKDRPRRSIINISSKAGKSAIPGVLPYVASKFALEGMTANMAEELRDANIRVNSISPGMVDTPGFPKAPGRAGVRTAESIRDGLLFLCNGEMTGKYLHVDELDLAVSHGEAEQAAKEINEPKFGERYGKTDASLVWDDAGQKV